MLVLVLLLGSLPHYEVTVEPEYLEQLYANPFAGIEVPASVSLEGEEGECTLSFRGGTSLWCAKKGWHITTDDPDLFPCGRHILLNAQFRDPSLMRNTLGLFLTRELGFPAPETEFVSLSINGENIGVYERVERIDRLFYERNGLAFGPLFKNTDTMGRLSHHLADTTALAGYEPRVDSSVYGDQLLGLIEASFRGDVSSLDTQEVLAEFAVHVAIHNNDGVIKNFYLHRSGGLWHYYPWDRDATFGNSWEGVYDSNWVAEKHLADIGYFGAARAILQEPENIQEFNYLLAETAEIMGTTLPHMVDSLNLVLRNELAVDPYYQYSVSQFDSICASINSDIENRSDYLEGVFLSDEVPDVSEISLSSCLSMEDTLEIQISLSGQDADGVACVVSFDGTKEQWMYMEQEDHGSRQGEWELCVPVPQGTYCVHTAFGPYGSADVLPVFFPSWGIRAYHQRPDPTPSARVALAGFSPSLLSPGTPVWCGNNLWVLPVTNSSDETQDLSLCMFSVGEPAGNVFLPESTLIAPGKTFLLTNSGVNAKFVFQDNAVFGSAGTQYPAGTPLTLSDPSWNPVYSWDIGNGDSLYKDPYSVIPCEICAEGNSDWVELFNNSPVEVDLSLWYLMDSENNISVFPERTTIGPFGLLLSAEKPEEFQSVPCAVVPLEFGVNPTNDSLRLCSRFNNTIFSMSWNENWPVQQTGIVYLKSPYSDYSSVSSWASIEPPGTPGEANPGWGCYTNYADIYLLSENPCSGSFSFHYETSAAQAQVLLFDLSGRVVTEMDLPGNYQGEVSADFQNSLPNGVYILYLKSSAGSASTRVTVLK